MSDLLDAFLHYIQVHPVRSAGLLSLAVVVVLFGSAYLQYQREQATEKPKRKRASPKRKPKPSARVKKKGVKKTRGLASAALRDRYLRPALTLGGVLSLAAIGAALAYRGYTDVLIPERLFPSEFEPDQTFGIDVSHYQAKINWDAVAKSDHPIKFVFLRATMGVDGLDDRFEENWEESREHGFVRGAYHYFRPAEDGESQFRNFVDVVDLEAGDLSPVLDIEVMSRRGPEHLRAELKRWLELAKAHYGVPPIIYTGYNFYYTNLDGYFDEYPLWVAHYSDIPDTTQLAWRFHQFTDKVRVKGILSRVDGNNFRGSLREMEGLRVR